MKIKAVILGAGQGTRMKSSKPKVLHQLFSKPLIEYPILAVQGAGAEEICVIVGHKAEEVQKEVGSKASYRLQTEQLGTGHAVMQALDFIEDEGHTIVLYGDTPLITAKTLSNMKNYHLENDYSGTVLSAIVDDPTGYGRIIKDVHGSFLGIVEQKDASKDELLINEINGGMYIFKSALLKDALSKLTNNNAQNEYYFTDVIDIIRNNGGKIATYIAQDSEEILGVNSKIQLAQATNIMKHRINTNHMENGVIIIDPDQTYIEPEVVIGSDTTIEPGCMLKGATEIGEECVIGYNSKISNSIILSYTHIESSVILDSKVGEHTHVGPFAYIRPNSTIGSYVKVGDFVEIKNATLGDNTKVSHLTYIGDADVGKNVNFGCGTVVVNYDGKNKHRSTIEDNAFIGCNTNLVSPVTVEANAYTAAGSTITKNVPENALGVARAKQINVEDWVTRKGR
ncbi:MAG: bifunctional N-acetylglucosamine-1-phosphate uridyltransferase/glucosamine-1-phosphate acetyltransferase [Epulopiscium sp. Nele67-Bin002]|nr:MAG: UDP-N-acetylglucosamine diphosphorylase/glucosamine-1-phosphate N-acetyltransferase [Epulopiscium sp. Nuni2H_MBin001]OON91226.1 MAG: bifunctional N-acetylglucosamine-1-phosphate uridyltransferase/glucosamine-1-phosphate acetyltransferase [Epulopiscium sp. Nele67-Bin002]